MPLTVSQRLGMITLQSSRVLIGLADKSVPKPEGRVENIPIKVGGCWILTDFVILDLDDDTQGLILGRPFLATTHSSINVPKGRITLCFKKTFMKFYIGNQVKMPTMDGQTFWVD
ncbi:hypothetical protein V5N11_031400 [Cardamine amara subsp. amara]|uniref:Uncharacterized protein n=1 Tax=Cardamine amara subsp. amara TaxID=228776 RepID=A0ABD1A7I0_CARAN